MWPTYIFRINLSEVYTASKPDSHANMLHKMQHQTVNINGISRPLKHGDTFSLSGSEATKLKHLIDTNQLPFKIDVINIPNVSNLGLNVDGYSLEVTWQVNGEFKTYTEMKLNDEEWQLVEVDNPGVSMYAIEYDRPGNLHVRSRHSTGDGFFSYNYTTTSIEVPSPKYRIKDPGVQGYSIEQLEGGLSISSGVPHTVTISQEGDREITTITSPTFKDLNDMYYNMAVFDLANPILFPDEEPLRDQNKKLRFVTPDYVTAESSVPLISELTLFKGNTKTTYITSTFNADSKFYYGGLGSPAVPGPFFDPVGVEAIP